MTWTETLMLLLGSDILTGAVVLLTLRSTIAKARSEAEKAKAEAESLRITNTEQATRVLMENIVKPLKDELHATRDELRTVKVELESTKKEMSSTKRAMGRLRKAIDDANGCDYRDRCPVLERLRDISKTDRDEPAEDCPDGGTRQLRKGDQDSGHRDTPGSTGEAGPEHGQPGHTAAGRGLHVQ